MILYYLFHQKNYNINRRKDLRKLQSFVLNFHRYKLILFLPY